MKKRRHLIQGKTVREWADHFGITVGAVYLSIYRGNFESRVNGTYQRKHNPKKIYEGKTLDEWSEILGMHYGTVQKYAKKKVLSKILSGEYKTGNCRHLVRGKTLRYWGDKLGITRERARQLDEDGYLEARIDGAGPRQADNSRYMMEAKKRREEAVEKYIPGEKVVDFAKRLGVKYPLALSWLNKEGVKRTSQGYRKKAQKYKERIKDEKKQCKACKYFKVKSPYWCELGKFCVNKKWGGCSKHEL